jgi:hypothetical protein
VPGAAGEGAATHLAGQRFGEDGGGLLAVSFDQRAEGGEEGGMGQCVAVEPILLRFVEGVLDITIGDASCVATVLAQGGVERQIVWKSRHRGGDSAAWI